MHNDETYVFVNSFECRKDVRHDQFLQSLLR
jgi:hypothetical protein